MRVAVHIQATAFSGDAIARIEGLGGSATAVYHNDVGMRQLIRPHLLKLHTNFKPPMFDAPMTLSRRTFYSDWSNRGYLHPDVRTILLRNDPTFDTRYRLAKPYTPPAEFTRRLSEVVDDLRQDNLLPY